MGFARVGLALLALAPGVLPLAPELAAQGRTAPGRAGPGEDVAAWRPAVFSFVLEQAGHERLDPFGSTGRREVIQLLAHATPFEGRFQRVRVDRFTPEGRPWAEEGWYVIENGTITLYAVGPDGGVASALRGPYDGRTICLTDPEDGRLLRYAYLAPASDPPATPPPAAAPVTCAIPGETAS